MNIFQRYWLYFVNDSEKRPVQVEALYQEFKARLIVELKVSSPELLNFADIVDTEIKDSATHQ